MYLPEDKIIFILFLLKAKKDLSAAEKDLLKFPPSSIKLSHIRVCVADKHWSAIRLEN